MTNDAVMHRALLRDFPRLRRDAYRRTSEPSMTYNCFAWAVGETHRRWDPTRDRRGYYWPAEARSTAFEDAVTAFEAIGFSSVAVARPRPDRQTIALYAVDGHVTHAARLLENGRWTSKLGPDIDIEHTTLEALGGGSYGEPAAMLERSLDVAT